jgi:hypothetical protein
VSTPSGVSSPISRLVGLRWDSASLASKSAGTSASVAERAAWVVPPMSRPSNAAADGRQLWLLCGAHGGGLRTATGGRSTPQHRDTDRCTTRHTRALPPAGSDTRDRPRRTCNPDGTSEHTRSCGGRSRACSSRSGSVARSPQAAERPAGPAAWGRRGVRRTPTRRGSRPPRRSAGPAAPGVSGAGVESADAHRGQRPSGRGRCFSPQDPHAVKLSMGSSRLGTSSAAEAPTEAPATARRRRDPGHDAAGGGTERSRRGEDRRNGDRLRAAADGRRL